MESCPICFTENDIEANIDFVKLECDHSICDECYQKWHIQLSNSDCVICRKTVVNIPPTPTEPDNTIQELYSNLGIMSVVLMISVASFLTLLFVVKDTFWKVFFIMFSCTIIPILLFCIDNIILSIIRTQRRIWRNGTQNSQQNVEVNNVQS
tara:strand:- start:1 stop:456 length:456 start_codon:yes stop_codon:yes gene_type:complete